MRKFGVGARFLPHDGKGDAKLTIYTEHVFDTKEDALLALDGEYGDLLSQASTLDTENEPDLEGYYLDDMYVLEVEDRRIRLTRLKLFLKNNGAYELHGEFCTEHKKSTDLMSTIGVYETHAEAEAVWEQRNEMGTTIYGCCTDVVEA